MKSQMSKPKLIQILVNHFYKNLQKIKVLIMKIKVKFRANKIKKHQTKIVKIIQSCHLKDIILMLFKQIVKMNKIIKDKNKY